MRGRAAAACFPAPRGISAALIALGCALGCPSRADRAELAPHGAAGRVTTAAPARTEVPASRCGRIVLPEESPSLGAAPGPVDPPRQPIVRPEAMKGFYEALARLVRGRATDHVRIAVFGDSNLTMDFTSGRMRRKLQRRFGDAGHGFVALSKPWSHYQHMDVRHDAIEGWVSYVITTKPIGDGLYGLGGIAAENQWQGASTFVATAREGAPVGTRASRFDVFYLERPSGGDLELRLDGVAKTVVSTNGPSKGLGFYRLEAEDGPHRLDVLAASSRGARIFGAALERDAPGVVVDSFGVGALNTKTLGRHDPAMFHAMLRKRRYDLVVFLTGANDVFTMDAVPPTMRRVLALCRDALPDASLLMATPPDRGLKKPFPQTLAVVAQRRLVAADEGCALWDQFDAMGGAGSMATFVKTGFAMGDAIHFNERGAAFIADRFVAALLEGFEAHLEATPDAGCADDARERAAAAR